METVPATHACPAWCTINHQKISPTFHALCTGEVRRKHGSVVVAVTRDDDSDGVELAYHVNGKAPAIAFLSEEETRELRDYLDGALTTLCTT